MTVINDKLSCTQLVLFASFQHVSIPNTGKLLFVFQGVLKIHHIQCMYL